MNRAYYFIRTDGNTWQCTDPTLNFTAVGTSVQDLINRMDLQFLIGVEPFKKWKKVSTNGNIITYKAYWTTDFQTRFSVENFNGSWTIWKGGCKARLQPYQPSYDALRNLVFKAYGYKMPAFKSLELDYREENYCLYSLQKQKIKMTKEEWESL